MPKKTSPPIAVLAEPVDLAIEKALAWARSEIHKHSPTADGALHNCIFYWGDEACDLAYINNTECKSAKQFKKLIAETDGACLDGSMVELEPFSLWDLPLSSVKPHLPFVNDDVRTLQFVMDQMGERLLKDTRFRNGPNISKDFVVLTVFH